jgi:hypothetical protein
MRDWFWEIEEGRHGPDTFFFMAFEPDDAPLLLRLVPQHIGADFQLVPCEIEAQRSVPHSLCYTDERTHQKLVEQVEAGQRKNIWIYSEIRVQESQLEIEAGFCGMKMASETALIVALARSPELSLRRWSVRYGGQGYGSGALAEGEDAASLLKYLQAASSS